MHKELGITIILVSHSMDDVARFADRIFVMNKGEKYLEGTPREIFAHDEELISLGLGIPQVTQILKRLKKEGWAVRTDIVELDAAKEEILKAWRARKGGNNHA